MAGHLAMNHAIIAWARGNGHQVTVLLVRPRLRAIIERYGEAEVAGIEIGNWRGYVFAKGPGIAAGILARALLTAVPALSMLRKPLRMRHYGSADTVLGAFATPEQSAWCAEQLLKLAPDAVFADTIFRAPVLFEPGLARVRRVIIAHDLFHLRHQALRSAGYGVFPAELPKETEAKLLNAADSIVAIQPEEAAIIREMCPERSVCTAPMPALPCPRPGKTARIPGRLVFVGSATLPNLDGLRWLFAEIWPALRQQVPEVTLDLAGDCGAAFPRLPKGVTRLGRVENLSPVLHRSALAISPLRIGSGLKIKMLDYARHGLVTVASTESLRGFAADTHAPFVAAGDAAAFAAAVAAKLRHSDAKDEERALEYVTRHYDLNSSFSGLAAMLGMPVAGVARPVESA
jgi:succinoglycan biosynthesis protein ExoO